MLNDYASIPVKTSKFTRKKSKGKSKVVGSGFDHFPAKDDTTLPPITMQASGVAHSEITDRGISPSEGKRIMKDDKGIGFAHGTHTGGFVKKIDYGGMSENSETQSHIFPPSMGGDKNDGDFANSARKVENGFMGNNGSPDQDYLDQ